MGGWITIIICVATAFLFYGTGHTVWFTLAVLNTLLNFWSLGVMHNYASYARRDKAKRLKENLILEGRLDDETLGRISEYERGLELGAVPDGLVWVDMLFSFFAIVLLIVALYFRLF